MLRIAQDAHQSHRFSEVFNNCHKTKNSPLEGVFPTKILAGINLL